MIKTILVPAGGGRGDAAIMAAALAVARPFGAHLDVLHVRFDATATAVAMASDGGSGALTPGLVDQLEAEARDREARAKEGFARFCAGADIGQPGAAASAGGVSGEWHVETGDEARWIVGYGMTADLIVAGRGTEEEPQARATLEAVLLETGRPLLIPAVAAMPAAIERVAIAWKPTPQAARAVALATPFLARAKEILLLIVEERADEHDTSERLVRNLGRFGAAARAERLQAGAEGAAATLLAAASGRADLLVMGGYGHTRLREWVFGGFTQQTLAHSPLPVLIAH